LFGYLNFANIISCCSFSSWLGDISSRILLI
jgi:hypothetical protein